MLLNACRTLRKRTQVDHYGVSVDIILFFCVAHPIIAVDFFSKLLSSTRMFASIVIEGRLFGKESSVSSAAQLRAILPLPAIMQVVDVLLPELLASTVDQACPPIPGCFVGARPGTQALDIAHGLQAIIEKGLDDKSRSAVAQADIEKYYDSLDPILLVQWLLQHGASLAACGSILRHQMQPQVYLRIGNVRIPIHGRCVGCLTGSRVAGFLGRIPVESTISERHHTWMQWGYQTSSHTLNVCVYVDNIYSASSSLHGAVSILEDFEAHLRDRWRLRIKPSSRSCLVARGSDDVPQNPGKWPLSSNFQVLRVGTLR